MFDIFRFPKRFKEAGIVGINARNRDYIFRNNERKYYPLVDDKLQTKIQAKQAGIATPELYGVIEYQGQVGMLDEIVKNHKEFVIKPAHGSGGGGILVINGHSARGYRKSSGSIITHNEMKYHIANILSGMYAMGTQSDKALIEYRVDFDPIFDSITYQGVPDIRILVLKGVPVMGMLRLPTRESDGKANLHMGGLGVGIDMATGETLFGVQHGGVVDAHPDTGITIKTHVIPQWEKLLEMASKFHELTHLGYIGVDIVLDKHKGPMILEVNARPGIAIQVANQEGLMPRLKAVEEHIDSLHTTAEKVAFAIKHFGRKRT